MRVLAAILAQPGRVSLDIAGIESAAIEGWGEQEDELRLPIDQLLTQRGHRQPQAAPAALQAPGPCVIVVFPTVRRGPGEAADGAPLARYEKNRRVPFGEFIPFRSIVEKIMTSRVPVIVYVAPAGSRAASAGLPE